MGETVSIVGLRDDVRDTVCTGVEMFHKMLDEGQAGDNVGCLLRGIEREDVERGMVLAKPGSIKPHTEFDAEVYVLKKDEGGRHKAFFPGYRPQFLHSDDGRDGRDRVAGGRGDGDAGRQCEHARQADHAGGVGSGRSRFAIREGGLTVGAGVITKIAE